MSKSQVKKLLVVGLGSIGKRHVQIVSELYPEIQVAVLRHKQCDEQKSRALKVDACFTCLNEAIAFEPDAAILANPASMHIESAMKLAQVGVHLLIEKPLSVDSQGINELIDLCNKQQLILMTAYNLRFLPSLIYFKKQLEQGCIGNMCSIIAEVGQYLPAWRPDVDYRKTVSAQKKLGGGVLLELSHEIDYLLWLFGSVEWISAHLSKQSRLEIDVEDVVQLRLGFKQDLKQKEKARVVATLNMDFIRHDTTRQCVVIGEKGSLRWDAVANRVDVFLQNEQDWQVLYSEKVERNYCYEKEIEHFFYSIENNQSPIVSGQAGLDVVLIIEAAKESHVSKQQVCVSKVV